MTMRRIAATVTVGIATLVALPGAAQGGVLSKVAVTGAGTIASSVQAGPIAVSRSESSRKGATWSALKVGDRVVIGRTSTDNHGGSGWTGLLASAGRLVDDGNGYGCNAYQNLCVTLLPGYAGYYGNSVPGADYHESYAQGSVASIYL